MNDADAINELRDRLGRAEDRLSKGDGQFTEVLGELQNVTAHLKRQDAMYAELGAKIDAQGKSTEAIVDMWSGGVKTVRFFCRLAESWNFVLHKVFIPVVLPLAGLWTLYRIFHHEALPDFVTAAIKLVLAVL